MKCEAKAKEPKSDQVYHCNDEREGKHLVQITREQLTFKKLENQIAQGEVTPQAIMEVQNQEQLEHLQPRQPLEQASIAQWS